MFTERLKEVFRVNAKRVVLQKFALYSDRAKRVIDRVLTLSEKEIEETMQNVFVEFNGRHRNIRENILANYDSYSHLILNTSELSINKKLLIGAYFSKEYSIEAAALFNPSIIPHPDQSGLNAEEMRFILSLRATGEGHISSIEFREGIINKNNQLELTPISMYATLPKNIDKKFKKDEIINECLKANFYADNILEGLPEECSVYEYVDYMNNKLVELKNDEYSRRCLEFIDDYTDSNYDVYFEKNIPLSERVLFPKSKSECMGMEDVRFVKFTHEDKSVKYYGTYTAYNGKTFRTQLIETTDYEYFQIRTLTGAAIKDKGMALFPRKIGGKFYMLGRQDGEHIFLMCSDDLYYWNEYKKILGPSNSWEFVQLGNCGSPIETEHGWLVIMHAVGPVRKYVVSAVLLDKEQPSKVIGRLSKPLISPNEEERDGYVPNVVYSSGSLVHNDELIIPYAMSDTATGFAKIDLKELLNQLITN